jgi:uncharacterized protein YbbK (DUF523 family)
MTETPEKIYAVSACLLGIHCRYNGGHKRNTKVLAFLEDQLVVPVCPELISGLPLPRPPAEISSGDGRAVLAGEARVKLAEGTDVTEAFLRGAREAVQWVELSRATHAILKERSPSCGVNQIYRQGQLVPGSGIFTALLRQSGIEVISEEELA